MNFIRVSENRIIRKDQILQVQKMRDGDKPVIYYTLVNGNDVWVQYPDVERRNEKFESVIFDLD